MALSRTDPQVTLNGWAADFGETNDVPMVFLSTSPDANPDLPPLNGITIYYRDLPDFAQAVQNPGVAQQVFLCRFETTRFVAPPGTGPVPVWVEESPKYAIYDANGTPGVPLLSVPAAGWALFVDFVLLAGAYPGAVPGNDWDSTTSETVPDGLGFYPGLMYPGYSMAVPGWAGRTV